MPEAWQVKLSTRMRNVLLMLYDEGPKTALAKGMNGLTSGALANRGLVQWRYVSSRSERPKLHLTTAGQVLADRIVPRQVRP